MQHEAPPLRTPLPTGTVTLMFTDIAGSTALLEQHGDGYADLLEAHRRIIRDAVGAHGGVEVDTQGDAFFVAFPRASDAAAAAGVIVSRLAAEGPVRVRVGLHTGEPRLSAGGYVGMDVHRAARISAAAHGGQVVLSQQTRELLGDVEARDLGSHRLKDVGEMRLHQLGLEEFPPLRSLARTNLRSGRELVGRAEDAAGLVALIEEGRRFVTLTGAGGIGKTSLAREVAWTVRERFSDGAWFVDLSNVAQPDLVLPEIAATIGSPPDVLTYLANRQALLVLDNLEHLLDAAPSLADLVDACAEVSVLATSRAPLHISAEREYPLEPLRPSDGAELFRRQATAVAPRFDASQSELADLSRHLDGLPLAIELAAARSRILSHDQLRERLDRRLEMLTGGARDAPARHRTLEATIAWSFDLLEPEERAAFSALAVFAGEWRLEIAEQVTGCSLDQLHALVDKNLLQADAGRFRMLETVREFAVGRLAELPDAQRLRERHADAYAAVAREIELEITASRQQRFIEDGSREYPNVRAALEWCFAEGRGSLGARIAGSLVLFWFIRGMYAEGTMWLQRAEAVEALDDDVRSRVLWGLGTFATLRGDAGAAPALTQALELAERCGDGTLASRIMMVEALLAFFADDPRRSLVTFERGIELARASGDAWSLADGLGTSGSIYPFVGDYDRAVAAAAEALSVARAREDSQGIRMALFTLALTGVRTGDLPTVREAGEEGLEICRALGDLWFVSYFLWLLSTASRLAGDAVAAAAQAEEALDVARRLGAPLLLVCALEASAAAARAAGDDGRAGGLLAEAVALSRGGAVPGSFASEALRASAELAADSGDAGGAERLAKEAVDRARAVGDPWAERRAAEMLARARS